MIITEQQDGGLQDVGLGALDNMMHTYQAAERTTHQRESNKLYNIEAITADSPLCSETPSRLWDVRPYQS